MGLWRFNLIMLRIKSLFILQTGNNLKHFGQLVHVVAILARTKRHIVQKISLFLLRQIDAILLEDFEEFAAGNEVVLRLAHAFIPKTI